MSTRSFRNRVRGSLTGVSFATDQHDDARPIAIARDQIRELRLCVRERLRILPLDSPVDRHLFPQHQAQLVGDARHVLVVRVVREPHEVAAQLLGPAEQQAGVFHGVRASATQGIFLVERDAAQEDRTAVQKNVGATDSDAAKADAIVDAIIARR